jgi:hypothetical protein
MSGASLCGTRLVVLLLLQLLPSSVSSSLEKDIQDFLSFNTRVNSRHIGDDDNDDVTNPEHLNHGSSLPVADDVLTSSSS